MTVGDRLQIKAAVQSWRSDPAKVVVVAVVVVVVVIMIIWMIITRIRILLQW